MPKTIDLGLFVPAGNHAWIHSVNAPAAEDGSYARARSIVAAAEQSGFGFVITPAIWRGRKGPSRHWMHALESLTTTSALLEATDRIKIFSTVHMTVFPPAVVAKIVATQDQIGPGRVGLNLVTGSSYLDLAHLGLWEDKLDHDARYNLADEWVSMVKALWTDEVVDFHGEHFQTMEATMGPKPSRLPELVNAGASARGFRFAAQNCDAAVIPASEDPKAIDTARRGKQAGRDAGGSGFRTFGVAGLVPGRTDEEARARMEYFDAGVDLECLADIAAGYNQNPSAASLSDASKTLGGGTTGSAVNPGTMVGSFESLGRRLAQIVIDADYDALMLTLPDYLADLDGITSITVPVMAECGVSCRLPATSPV